MPQIKPDQFDGALASKKLKRVYLFDGPENWLKERAVARLIDTLLPPEARDFNLERLDADTHEAGQALSSAQSLPFLADRRVVVVKNADEYAVADTRLLAEALPNLPETTCLVLVYNRRAESRAELPAVVASQGDVVTFWTPFKKDMPSWIMGEAKRRGKPIEMDAAGLLAEACTDLQEVSNELDKLILFTGKKKAISYEDVQAHGLPDEAGDYRLLDEAIWSRDLAETLRQSDLLQASGVAPEAILAASARVVRQMVQVSFFKRQGWGWGEIFQTLYIKGITQQRLIERSAGRYTAAELEAAPARVVRAEMDIKTGALAPALAVTLLFLGWVGKGRPTPVASGFRQ